SKSAESYHPDLLGSGGGMGEPNADKDKAKAGRGRVLERWRLLKKHGTKGNCQCSHCCSAVVLTVASQHESAIKVVLIVSTKVKKKMGGACFEVRKQIVKDRYNFYNNFGKITVNMLKRDGENSGRATMRTTTITFTVADMNACRRAPSIFVLIQDDNDDELNEMTPAVIQGNDQVTGHIISTTIGGKNGEPKRTISYMAERVVGTGSFGIVFQAKCLETGETMAIKKVLQDRRYKNRELQLMRLLDHPNVVSLKHCFFSTTSKDELFLNLVMEYVPESLYRVLKHYSSMNQRMPLIYVKLYTYQIFRGLAYIHTVPGVAHRDIKPQNLLVDPLTHQLKICDFGSAKVLVKGEPNISYICSRYYRAPELIFGATEYTTSIDIWSVGCVLAELLLGQPLFPGENAVDQLVEIIKVLGTPTREEIRCMNPNYTDFRFPQIKAHPWHKVFHKRMPPEAIDLASRLLQYSPSLRCTALEACAHPFFDELREANARLPNGRPLPPLFNFKQEVNSGSVKFGSIGSRHISWLEFRLNYLTAWCRNMCAARPVFLIPDKELYGSIVCKLKAG
ncbi:hypothetical protein KSS87_008317, partial [Heliosperma pusillum]